MIGLGIGVQYSRVLASIDTQAQAHYDRVIADGGIIPAGLLGCSNYISGLKSFRGVTTLDTSNTCALKQAHYLGLKLATGTGATAGNRACAKYYDLLGASYDAEQTTAANQPLALVNTGNTYVYLPELPLNYFSTPNSASNNFIGNFSQEYKVRQNTITALQIFGSKYGAGANLQFIFRLDASSRLNLIINQSSTDYVYVSTASVPYSINADVWVRFSRNSTTGEIKFYTSTDGTTYTQLGTTVSGITGNLTAPTQQIEIGSAVNGVSSQAFSGVIYYAKFFNDDSFTNLVQYFNPTLYNRTTSQTTFTASTGEVWTINTPATNNALKAEFVDTTMIMGNGTAYGLRSATLNITQSAMTNYTIFKKYVNTLGAQIVTELGASPASGTSQGKYYAVNGGASQEEFGIQADVGLYNSLFTSNSLNLKLATSVNNIANANESLPLLINNVSQSFVASGSSLNNTAAMNATGYNYLARNNAASLWFNGILVSDAVFVGEDDAAKFLATYNFLKTYTNGI